MGETYENKSFDIIKQDIKKEFKNIEDSKRGRYRDDQEIYEAGENIITRYINQLSNANGMRVSNEKRGVNDGKAKLIKSENLYKGEALKYFKDAKAQFSKRWDEVLKEHGVFGMYITTSSANEKQIIEVAKSIDKAEEEALNKITTTCNPKQEQDNAVENSKVVRDNQGNVKVNNGELVKQKPLFTQSSDGTLAFTDRVNPIKINQALGDLFKKKDKIYKIDYTRCTNQKIKDKMQNLIGGLSCWIKYDENYQTYVLTDRTGKMLNDRALVWEGVTLKQDSIIKSQSQDNQKQGMTSQEQSSLETLRSTSKPFEFNPSNYLYYKQYHDLENTDICAAYAYGVVSDVLSKSGYCFNVPEVCAWEMLSSSLLAGKVNIKPIDNTNPKQQIINAPAGTFLTVKYEGTRHQTEGVSHVMVSLGNGIYTDLFGSNIRQFDMKSEATFTGNTFTLKGGNFLITNESRLFSPNMGNLSTGSKQTIQGENITPEDFAIQVHDTTGANLNYIRSLIAKQNNITATEWWEKSHKYENLSVNIISKEITDLKLENEEGSNDVAKDFLTSLKDHKKDIMNHYPNLSNHEYDEIAKRAIGILYQESKAGDSIKYGGVGGIGGKEGWIPLYGMGAGIVKSVKGGERSRGYTQIKFNQIFSEEYNKDGRDFLKTFDINSGSDLTNAEKCGIATMVGLITNYNNIIIPMKSDPFRKNDAEIIKVTFNEMKNGKNIREDFARGKILPKLGRARTETELEDTIKEWGDKHGGILRQETITRKGITKDDDFFDFLYFARNKSSEIKYGTAILEENSYRNQANNFAESNLKTIK